MASIEDVNTLIATAMTAFEARLEARVTQHVTGQIAVHEVQVGTLMETAKKMLIELTARSGELTAAAVNAEQRMSAMVEEMNKAAGRQRDGRFRHEPSGKSDHEPQ